MPRKYIGHGKHPLPTTQETFFISNMHLSFLYVFPWLDSSLKKKKSVNNISLYCCLPVAKFYPTLCDPVNCRTPASLPCHSPSPRICSNSCPLNQWCYPIIWTSVAPFSCCPLSFAASGSFQMGQLFASGGQSIRVSASTSVLPMYT